MLHIARERDVLEQTQHAICILTTNITEFSRVLCEMSVTNQPGQTLVANSVLLRDCSCGRVIRPQNVRPTIFVEILACQNDLCANKSQIRNNLKILFLQVMVVNARPLQLLEMRHRFHCQKHKIVPHIVPRVLSRENSMTEPSTIFCLVVVLRVCSTLYVVIQIISVFILLVSSSTLAAL